MNLADAIRQAASHTDSAPKPHLVEGGLPAASTQTQALLPTSMPMPNPNIQLNSNSEPSETAPAAFGNFLRLELFLAPEQLSALLSAVVKTQHSVLTLREAASFLRLPISTVEQLASERKLPAFAIEGKWRFSHSALEEWLTSHPRSASNGKELK